MKKQFVKPELKIIAMEGTSNICAGSDGTMSLNSMKVDNMW